MSKSAAPGFAPHWAFSFDLPPGGMTVHIHVQSVPPIVLIRKNLSVGVNMNVFVVFISSPSHRRKLSDRPGYCSASVLESRNLRCCLPTQPAGHTCCSMLKTSMSLCFILKISIPQLLMMRRRIRLLHLR